MREVKLKGGPFDGQTLMSEQPLFELRVVFEPEDEAATVDVNDLETHTYRDVDANEADDVLTWCKNNEDPFAGFGG